MAYAIYRLNASKVLQVYQGYHLWEDYPSENPKLYPCGLAGYSNPLINPDYMVVASYPLYGEAETLVRQWLDH